MILLQAARVSKSFGARQILADVNFTIQEKSGPVLSAATARANLPFSKILTGSLPPDTGEVVRPRI